ncbi:MAG: leucine-rich repeat domain-containing protein [Oscillospiraceae bacterium]|nr:leucine-rich repeat domain-containing protein [Oscillospiraceae bacterium]
MNKRKGMRQGTALLLTAILLLCGTALPVFAEPDDPAGDPAVTDEAEQTTDAAADPDAETATGTDDTTTAETTTDTTTEGTTTERTEMTPPDPLSVTEYEETADGGILIRSFRWTCEKTVEIPAQIDGKPVTEIGESAFKYCYADVVMLPDTVERIGDRAFEGCAYLQAMNIPKACVSIGASAFAGCKSLEIVTLPDTVQEIGRDAFADTPFLTQQTGDALLLGNGILYAYRGTAADYTVPEHVRIIGAGAFASSETLRSVVIPAGVQQIQQGAFAGCTSLSEITAPDTVSYLAADAFADTKWLTAGKEDFRILGKMLIAYQGKDSIAEVPDGVQIINDGAFASHNGITTVRLPESVREIRDGAFRDCGSLQVAEFGDQLAVIGADAFCGCRTLNYLRIGHALETIGDRAFAGCPNLIEVYLPDTVRTVGAQAFGYSYDAETGCRRIKNELTLYANSSLIRSYAEAEGIQHEPLPDAENTAPAPLVTEPENASRGMGKVRGKAWIPAALLGGVLVLVGGISFAVRRKKESALD